ncbi:DNA polymerase IV [Nocardioides sp. TF02-7]|uniref:DNA polymerase IV n=1 Tax=Nocardioides sp. TF02-7 TaxID=2917724 RepID=UPI001F05579C|nr:DNA polymerase IV [Nocardioides sp. TF02-7]UMG93537.1 DNA polymerase IV [Nocardioides sp. TF02-7]
MGRVLHVDLDQFIAAVEVLRRPELAGRPVIVGGRGDPTERGVVSTASYEARQHGVGSGMPLRLAARKCKDAVFLPVDAEAYDAASAEVMAVLRGLEWGGVPVLVEVLGWDEAFVGPGPGHGDLGDPVAFAERVRSEVLAATRLRSAVGVGDNKLQAKLATGFAKRRVEGAVAREAGAGGRGDEPGPGGRLRGQGTYLISDETWFAELGDRPTSALWGIGAKTATRLAALGIDTVEDLARADPALLAERIGPTTGPWLRRLGRGVASSTVDPTTWVARGHGREETFQKDLTDWAEVEEATRRIAARAIADIVGEGRPAVRVGLKLRYRPFTTISRSHKLAEPSSDPGLLADEAVALLDRVDKERAVRLIGVRYEMADPDGAAAGKADGAADGAADG